MVQKKIVIDESRHNHPQPNTLPRRKIIQNLTTNSLTHSPNEAVAKAYINESSPSIKERNASKTIIYRLRKSAIPQPPETINLLSHSIKDYNFLKNNYLGNTVTPAGSVAFFTNLILLKALSVVEEINVAASHLSVPRSPAFCQLLTFHLKKNNQSIPALFIICSNNSAEMYSAIWDFLGSKLTKLKRNLKRIICSYENDFIIATKKKLPKVQIKGSWFHFIKLWTRQWKSLNLSMEPLPIILKIAWALPLLHKEKLQEGMKVLEFVVNCQHRYNINLTTYVATLKAWCLQLSSELSFYDNMQEEAINVAEDFLRQILRLLGYQKSLHTYLANIVNVLNNSSQQWLSRDEAQKIPRKAYQMKVNDTIRSFQSQLMKKKISITIFLNSVIDKALAEEMLIQLAHKQYELDDSSLWSSIPNPHLCETSFDSTDSASTSGRSSDSTSDSTSDSNAESSSNLDTTSDSVNRSYCNNTYDPEFDDIISDSDEDMFDDDN